MPIDNEMYNRLQHTWWDENGFLNLLKSGLNPGRFGYMRRMLTQEMGLDPKGLRVLDVGSGGGLLAEEFATLGCDVTGVDPAIESIKVAREHARQSGLAIEYVEGTGEALPFGDASFPVVYCCDVLEHVKDLGKVIAEISRVLQPGGVFLYDTLNRTWQAKLLFIKVAQDWKSVAWAPPNLHDYAMFIRPEELEGLITREGMAVRGRMGLAPRNKLAALKAMWDRAHGKITYAQMGKRWGLQEHPDTSMSYMGYAVKASALPVSCLKQ